MTIHQRSHGHSFTEPRSWLVLTPGRRLFVVLAVAVAWLLVSPAARAVAATSGPFVPPLPPQVVVLDGFAPPGEPWLAGNRGVDLSATTGEPVSAAAAGTVLYAGALAGRGVISIDHGGGIRTTYEPVDPLVHVGDVVTQGQLIGQVSGAVDNCGPPGSCLHWGAITANGYVDPLGFLGAPKIKLLPIWGNGLPGASGDQTHTPPQRRAVAAETPAEAMASQRVATADASQRSAVTAPVSGATLPSTALAAGALAASALAGGAVTLRRRSRSPS